MMRGMGHVMTARLKVPHLPWKFGETAQLPTNEATKREFLLSSGGLSYEVVLMARHMSE